MMYQSRMAILWSDGPSIWIDSPEGPSFSGQWRIWPYATIYGCLLPKGKGIPKQGTIMAVCRKGS